MADRKSLFLIVDDEPDMCWSFEHLLNKNGLKTNKALDGRMALELVKKHRFQMAFLDAKLPDIEGLDLAEEIRKIDPAVRIAMVSGFFFQGDALMEQAIEEGLIIAFIAKPFNHEEILRIISSVQKGLKLDKHPVKPPGL